MKEHGSELIKRGLLIATTALGINAVVSVTNPDISQEGVALADAKKTPTPTPFSARGGININIVNTNKNTNNNEVVVVHGADGVKVTISGTPTTFDNDNTDLNDNASNDNISNDNGSNDNGSNDNS